MPFLLDNGELRLVAQPSVMCYEGSHWPWAIIAWLVVLLWVIGIPVFIFVFLRHKRRKNGRPLDHDTGTFHATIDREENDAVSLRYTGSGTYSVSVVLAQTGDYELNFWVDEVTSIHPCLGKNERH